MDASWLTIQEYSNKHRISISTVRRKIKTNSLKHEFKDGRYLICDESGSFNTFSSASEMQAFYQKDLQDKEEKIKKLISQLKDKEQDIQKLIFENKNLNQLVQILEDQLAQSQGEPIRDASLD